MNYLYIFIAVCIASYTFPRLCLYMAAGNAPKTTDRIQHERDISKFLTVVFFISFTAISFPLYYIQVQRNIVKNNCQEANGVYVYQKHNNDVCIEKNAYDEYNNTIEQAYQKFMKAEIKVK